MEVVNVATHSPEAFGYASFNIDVVNLIGISVFIEENGKLVLTEASGAVYTDDGGFIQQFQLGAKVNYVQFEGNTTELFVLYVTKPGYPNFMKEFRYDSLMNELGGSPLVVILKGREATMTTLPVAGTVSATLGMGPGSGSIHVNWGDGTVETQTFVEDYSKPLPRINLTHTYATEGEYEITLTGSLDHVMRVDMGTIPLGAVNLSDIPSLNELKISNSSLDLLDLSRTIPLQWLTLDKTEVRSMPLTASILREVKFNGPISTETVDAVIGALRDNAAVFTAARDGILHTTHIDNFSEEAAADLDDLVNDYGWTWNH
jgi:hypothetical protein